MHETSIWDAGGEVGDAGAGVNTHQKRCMDFVELCSGQAILSVYVHLIPIFQALLTVILISIPPTHGLLIPRVPLLLPLSHDTDMPSISGSGSAVSFLLELACMCILHVQTLTPS